MAKIHRRAILQATGVGLVGGAAYISTSVSGGQKSSINRVTPDIYISEINSDKPHTVQVKITKEKSSNRKVIFNKNVELPPGTTKEFDTVFMDHDKSARHVAAVSLDGGPEISADVSTVAFHPKRWFVSIRVRDDDSLNVTMLHVEPTPPGE